MTGCDTQENPVAAESPPGCGEPGGAQRRPSAGGLGRPAAGLTCRGAARAGATSTVSHGSPGPWLARSGREPFCLRIYRS